MEALPDPNDPSGSKARKAPIKDPEGRMTFTEHLGELRTRLVRSGIAVFVGMILCYIVSDYIITLLARPLAAYHSQETIEVAPISAEAAQTPQPTDPAAPPATQTPKAEPPKAKHQPAPAKWVILNPIEPVLVKIKIAAYGGLLLALPYLIFHICAFIFPGLTPTEKRMTRVMSFGSAILAILGVTVAYWGVFPLIMPYLTMFAPDFVDVQLRMNETLSLLLKGFAGFAIAFQFPMIVLVLVYMDLLSPQTLKEYRRVAIVGLFAIAMLLTPPDPFSMLIMGLPLVLLYEMSIWISYLVVRRKKAAAAQGT